ncbi:MAG: transposase [Pontiellaceae bacterium]|nr:transposase [Pontiellaceae bacterium]
MSRGNRQDNIFLQARDYRLFLDTLEEACERTGWVVHAYVLMSNHYHLLLETPHPNLVDGMRWLQGTYTKRFNLRHKLWGHLLQGRYKALVIDSNNNYFRNVGDYIHLNPARARCFDLVSETLESYPWSSYPHYILSHSRPAWLNTNRLLGAHGFADDSRGRTLFEQAMCYRVAQLNKTICKELEEEWNKIRKGWAYGNKDFKKLLQEKISERTNGHARNSYSGNAIRTHDQHEAEHLLSEALSILETSIEELSSLKKNDPRKKVIAWLIRKNTSVRNQWISEHLHMGSPSNLSHFIREVSEATDGDLFVLRLKLLNNRTDT